MVCQESIREPGFRLRGLRQPRENLEPGLVEIVGTTGSGIEDEGRALPLANGESGIAGSVPAPAWRRNGPGLAFSGRDCTQAGATP